MARGEIVVKITGDESGLRRSLGNSERSLHGFGSKAKKIAKGVGVAIGGAVAAAAAGAGAVLKVGFGELLESERLTAQTNATIKSTGGVANVTARQVNKLADAIERKTGIDGEQTQESANMLLTFTNIRNEAGKGNDIFNQSVKVFADMKTAMPTAKVVALGKALNDPIKGVTALSKVGVTFTEQQKAQIKWLTASGNTMAAQKMILKELNTEFGGSAEAFGETTQGRIEKLKRKFEALAAGIAEKLLPVVEKVIAWLEDLSAKVEPVFAKLSSGVEVLVGSFGEGGKGVDNLRTKFDEIHARVQEVWPQIRAAIVDTMTTIQVIIKGVTDAIAVIWNNFGNNILTFVKNVWPGIAQQIRGFLQIIRGIVKLFTSLIRGDWSGAWKALKEIVRGVLNAIVGLIKIHLAIIQFVIGVALEIIGSMFKGAWRAAWNTTKDWWGKIVGFIEGIPAKILGVVGAVTGAAKAVGSAIWGGIKSGLGAVGDLLAGLRDAFDRTILAPIRSGIHSLANTLADVNIPGVGRAFDAASSALNTVANAIHLGDGGVVKARRGGTLALLGEKGQDEAVVPLNGRGGAFGGISIGTVVLGQSATLGDFSRELRWMQITRGVAARRP